MRKSGLSDDVLCSAVDEMERGLIDADLGGNVVKKRVPLHGRGKSGGARTILATNRKTRWFLVFGFQKNERANIAIDELQALRELAVDLLKLSPAQLDLQVGDKKLEEICHGC